MKKAITVWIDESTEISLNWEEYNLMGYLITDSDRKEFDFLNKLKQARKESLGCWNTIHGSEISRNDRNKIELIKRWLELFIEEESVSFYGFLYKKRWDFVPNDGGYERYFAWQAAFWIASKMKSTWALIQTMFKDVWTITVLFDRRRSHTATQGDGNITRYNDLENIYIEAIKEKIHVITNRDDITVRFSFLSSDCFDAMQLTDIMIFILRLKIEGSFDHPLFEIFSYFISCYFYKKKFSIDITNFNLQDFFGYDPKFNFFQSN